VARLSLFITLGIAAIDMLSCAFVSSVLLFVMFLLPQQSSGASISGSENHLIVHWTFNSVHMATFRIELVPPGEAAQAIWSDDEPDAVREVCENLSKGRTPSSACYLIRPVTPRDRDGMLVIEEPRTGKWQLTMRNGDTTTHTNAADEQPIDFVLTVIGKEILSMQVRELSPGKSLKAPDDSLALQID
jgi:hypothetical protein